MIKIGYKNLKHYRYTVHRYLDPLWKQSTNKSQARTTLYKRLSYALNLPTEKTHVSMFTRNQCKQAIKVLKPMYITMFGKDLPYKIKNKEDLKMNKSITRHEEFEVAHVLPNYDGPCGRLHGHSYKIEVTVSGPQTEPFGMIMDFKDLKKAIKEVVPDHKFVYYTEDEIGKDIAQVLTKHNIACQPYPFNTTAENMCVYFKDTIQDYIQNELGYKDVIVTKVDLWETTNSHATVED